MSWLFSRALVAEYSAGTSLDGAACALWNVIPTRPASWLPGKTTGACQLSRCGMTYAPLTDGPGAGVLMSYLEAFPVRTSVQLAKGKESRGSAVDSGEKWQGSFAKWDRVSCSWKTHQYSLLGGLELFSETWPRWGMMRDGACWEQPMPSGVLEIRARITSAIESGFLRLPTPRVADGERYGTAIKDTWKRKGAANLLRDWVQRYPTVTVVDDSKQVTRASGQFQSLTRVVQRLATPTKQDAHNNGAPAQMERNALPLNAQVGGPLNPTWVEWLMGWPIGWTALEGLEMGKFRQWCGLHGKL